MENLQELSKEELMNIQGGGKFWNWIKKNIGYVIVGMAIGGLVTK